ncbi:MAG: aminotransferase class V-fold PLP-dependent enzyme [Polyangiaceae bacterium]|nr:aminotransferase class V-fold PLP-dependent enzyme [Polyangiaceae bacterium]
MYVTKSQIPTYLDYASLVPPSVAVLDRMREIALGSWGPPGALHSIGWRARYALDTARQQVATYLGTAPFNVVFTDSGRASLALGFARALSRMSEGGTIVSSRLEHPSVQRLVEGAARAGRSVRWLALPGGAANPDDRSALRTAGLVALSLCNHELGTSLGDALEEVPKDAQRVLDAVQAAPWIPLDAYNDDRTFYAISGAKLGTPMGIGALRVPSEIFYRARESDQPLESESPPWLMAVGLGAACKVRGEIRASAFAQAKEKALALARALQEVEPKMILNGEESLRLGTILNVSFPGVRAKSLIQMLSMEGIAISHTAACQAVREEVSPVVHAAYPKEPERAASATRWSVSESTTDEEIACAREVIERILPRHRWV